jgi:DNA topoisomerase-1
LSLTRIAKSHYTLVVCEKPDAARRIAQALGTSGFKEISALKTVGRRGLPPVFSVLGRNNHHFVVCSAMGHLYGLVDFKGNRSTYPVFDVKWMPTLKKRNGKGPKTATRSQQIIKSISLLSQRATKFVHACDYDQEGEVIGYNVLEYACNNKYESSLRAKFSILTDEEIRNSFDNLLKPSIGLAAAGRSRHVIDFIYGVNLSRALTQSFKVSNDSKRYRNLSIGRVQGPTLAFVVDREMEITRHVPESYWNVSGEFEKNGYIIKANYYQQKISALSQATSIVNSCTNENGKITRIEKQQVTYKAPTPFNLGDLQKEAYRVFKFSPWYTLTIAEKLYIDALISYPRTASQQLPTSINYKKIILGLSKIPFLGGSCDNESSGSIDAYTNLAKILLARDTLSPNEGKLKAVEVKLFDLIIRRFLATFGHPAISGHTTVTILVKDNYVFRADGKKMLYEGWMYFYNPYNNRSGIGTELPDLDEGEILKNVVVRMDERFTQPPSRFNQASLLEQMEKEKIGTKATRSEVINTLFKRNYISTTTDKRRNNGIGGIEATDIGFEIIRSMRKYIPSIVSTDLTRSMEEQLERIELGKAKSSLVIDNAIDKIKEAIVSFKEKETEIGRRINDSAISTQNKYQQRVLGNCPTCNTGVLKIIRSSKTKKRFAGCSNYSSGTCNATAPLPQKGSIETMDKTCALCRWPVVKAVYSGQAKHHWEFCINLLCPSKQQQ